MKRNTLAILLVFGLLPIFVFAGDGSIPNWVHWAITAVGMIIAWFVKSPLVPVISGGVAKAVKLLDSILEARHPDSDGGKEITPEEWANEIFPQLQEIGELFKAIRKQEGVKVDLNSKFGSIDEELADILIYVCAIANRYGIDLETAFREKEKINHQRVWS